MNKEEKLFYEQALNELVENNYCKAIFSKAIAESHGDEKLARSMYIDFRVAQLMEDYSQAVQIDAERQSQMAELVENPNTAITQLFEDIDFNTMPGSDQIDSTPFEINSTEGRILYSACDTSMVLDVLPHEVASAIKHGLVQGGRYKNEWFIDLSSALQH